MYGEARITPDLYRKTDCKHFQDANRQLYHQMNTAPVFKASIESKYPGTFEHVSPKGRELLEEMRRHLCYGTITSKLVVYCSWLIVMITIRGIRTTIHRARVEEISGAVVLVAARNLIYRSDITYAEI